MNITDLMSPDKSTISGIELIDWANLLELVGTFCPEPHGYTDSCQMVLLFDHQEKRFSFYIYTHIEHCLSDYAFSLKM